MSDRMLARLLRRIGRGVNAALHEELRRLKKTIDQLETRDQRLEKGLRSGIERAGRESEQRLDAMGRTIETLMQQQADLRALLRARDRHGRPPIEQGAIVPVTPPPAPPATAMPLPEAAELPRDSIVELAACPVCGHAASTPVCEYNKLLLLNSAVDADAAVYGYAMCHACGVVSARMRPTGPRYAWLLDRFELTLGRAQEGLPPSRSLVLGSDALTDEERALLRQRAAKGVFVSEHLGLPKGAWVPALLKDRMANAVHVEMLGSLVPLQRPRVLELRPRLGSIGAALKRLYGAEVYAMPLFDGQQLLIREAYGFPAEHKVDFDRFTIPYPGRFDLVVANHMLTHVLHPCEFLATVRERLTDGGHLYLYNEADEREYLDGRASMINTLNAFHLQTFDVASLSRALDSAGFETVFVTRQGDTLIALARAAARGRAWTPMADEERERRLEAYRRARDLAILRLPDRLRGRFADEWEAIVSRALARGDADFDPKGQVRLVRRER